MAEFWSKLPKWAKIAIPALLVVVIVGPLVDDGSSNDAQGDDRATNAQSDTPKSEPKGIDPKAAQAKFEENAQSKIADMGDVTTWHPYFDKAESYNDDGLRLYLSTPGDYSKDEEKSLAKRAALAWFNFIGEDFPDLDLIVVYVNGTDRNTTYRSDVPLLNS